MRHNCLIAGWLTLLRAGLQLLKEQENTEMLAPLNAKKRVTNVSFKQAHRQTFS